MKENHEKYIDRCIQLAKNGLGTTYPNPLVGCVIVHNDRIIGEGWHKKAGEPHAEVHAINAVKDRDLLTQATLYVSLEPCSHFGKTPPCANMILNYGIPKIIIGTMDPFAEVSGRGIQKLKASGCEVVVGIRKKECQELNKRFFTFHNKKRPYIILKWAQNPNGFISPLPEKRIANEPVWISNTYSKTIVHKWRSEEQAIMVGTNTAIADNPMLNVRDWKGQNPVRIVIDQHARIPIKASLLDEKIKTIIITSKFDKRKSLVKNVCYEAIDFSKNIGYQIVQLLHQHNLQSLIIEGGSRTLQTFIDENLWDEARIIEGNTNFKEGIRSPILTGKVIQKTKIQNDLLTYFIND